MIRVVVVEDSNTSRALLIGVLRNDPDIQVVGEARDGVEGLALIQKVRPDVATMDVHMPGMDGLEVTREVMITAPTPIVIVTSSSSSAEVGWAMNALRAGAVAVLQKPAGPGTPGFEREARQLVDTVKAMAAVKVVRQWRSRPVPLIPPLPRPRNVLDRLVALAASTGGPAALQVVLTGLPAHYATPIVVVQHITRGFVRGLADWLDGMCSLRVKVAEDGESLAPGTVYLAPDDFHLGVTRRGKVALADAPPVGGFRPAASYLFSSAADAYGSSATAVILTGMGDDGTEGLRAIRLAGGRVIAQDEKSCVVFGMPAAAIAAGVVDFILPIDEIAAQLAALPGATTIR